MLALRQNPTAHQDKRQQHDAGNSAEPRYNGESQFARN
jgi:hypothetical protein